MGGVFISRCRQYVPGCGIVVVGCGVDGTLCYLGGWMDMVDLLR